MGLGQNLTWHKRLLLESYLRQGLSKQEIANRLHVCRATVYNEINRGKYQHLNGKDWTVKERYSPDIAEARYQENLRNHGGDLKIGNDHELANYIEYLICEKHYSPAAVLGDIQEKQLFFSTQICEKTLYNYIDKGIFLRLTNKDLPRQGKGKKRKYRKVKAKRPSAGTSIEERPPEVELRIEFGHWEMDTVVGKKGTKEVLLVLTERKTRMEIVFKMPDKTVASTIKCLDKLERRYGKRFPKVFKSITVDNGSEFSDQAGMEKSCRHKGNRTKFYYCHPYSAYERGSNENQNKLIRRFLPKGTDFRCAPAGYIRQVQDWINNYPREILGFASSGKLFLQELSLLA